MTTNPAARNLFELINSHKLSLRGIASVAGISEGAIRHFRDTPGRTLNKQTRISLARALHQQTKKEIDIASLFGNEDDRHFQWAISNIANTDLANILIKKEVTPGQLAFKAGVQKHVVISLLRNEKIDNAAAASIADFLGVSAQEIGIRGIALTEPFSPDDEFPVEFVRDLPIRMSLIVRQQPFRLSNGDDKLNFHELKISQDLIGATTRPPSLINSADAYAIYARDSQMWPSIREGEIVYVDPNWPTANGDDVIVYPQSGTPGHAFLAYIVSKHEDEFTFSCYTSTGIWTIKKDNILAIHKILRGQELISR